MQLPTFLLQPGSNRDPPRIVPLPERTPWLTLALLILFWTLALAAAGLAGWWIVNRAIGPSRANEKYGPTHLQRFAGDSRVGSATQGQTADRPLSVAARSNWS
ncbi:MAG TPA: hypothetical protein VFB96_26130 [Pirellulaceae bacterium]|nr:hypothetical protein [Pirellulaceae bacterium]